MELYVENIRSSLTSRVGFSEVLGRYYPSVIKKLKPVVGSHSRFTRFCFLGLQTRMLSVCDLDLAKKAEKKEQERGISKHVNEISNTDCEPFRNLPSHLP